jgi:ribonuclease Y
LILIKGNSTRAVTLFLVLRRGDFVIEINVISLTIVVLSALVVASVMTYFLYNSYLANKKATIKDVMEKVNSQVEQSKKKQLIKFREEMQHKRSRFQEEFKSKENQISRSEAKLVAKEKELRRLENNLKYQENKQDSHTKKLNEREESLYEKHRRVEEIIDEQNKKLEVIAGINVEDAKKELLTNLESRVKLEAAQMVKELKDEAQLSAQREAKEIIANAIENLACDFTTESTLSTVQLPNERFKGMIIGREGRNIRTFEEASGVKVIVDDTPEMIVLSAFDPVRREIARNAMENLIKSKNINPNLIEQALSKATKEVDRNIAKSAEDTLNELGLRGIHPQIKECLGRLRYRYSYGQNMLQHSKEVSLLSGALAAELGFSIKLARRAGLLHDIGKALTVNSEGSHVQLGVELCTKHKEHEIVINSILAHHEEAEPISPISVLVTAADKISGSRPGARRDTLEAYTKRITALEEIANSFDGVSKTYAISAGREIRVIVEPERLNDEQTAILSSDIAEKIKQEMEYPGQIKVCVIRQTIASKLTDEFEGQETNNFDPKST